MKKIYLLSLFAVLSISAFAETDSYYYWFYNKVESAPTGKGVIYASDGTTVPESDADYTASVEVKNYEYGSSYGSLYVWAQPAEGYQFAGWFTSATDETTMAELVDAKAETTLSVTAIQSTEDDTVEGYGFEPDNTFYGVFSKVKVQAVEGLESVASIDISKVANDKGDNITITATPYDEKTKFEYWLDSKGNKITENPYSFTVSDVETYTAYFSGDSILVLDFGEGKYIPFSNKYSANIGDLTGYHVTAVEKAFYDSDSNYITFDETENNWGYWTEETEYDSETDTYVTVSRDFHKYEGEIPSFDNSYEVSTFSYNYNGGDGVILYGEGKHYLVLTYDEYAAPWAGNFLVATSEGAVNIADLPAQDAEENAMTYYVFDGTDFVKATSGTVPQNECYLALDATQYPLPEKIYLGTEDPASIEAVAESKAAPKLMGIYTIDGKQLTAPVRGLNIINGKVVLVK
ncbi:MAG: hypothetical protein IJ693_09970 [Bacteroidaceae bacterium]|nr:hypothetical protein [Bacteroidaceae bacterium]